MSRRKHVLRWIVEVETDEDITIFGPYYSEEKANLDLAEIERHFFENPETYGEPGGSAVRPLITWFAPRPPKTRKARP